MYKKLPLLLLLLLTACGSWQVSVGQQGTEAAAATVETEDQSPPAIADDVEPSIPASELEPIPGMVYRIEDEVFIIDDQNEAARLPIWKEFSLSPTSSMALIEDAGEIWLIDVVSGEQRNLTEASEDWACCAQWWPEHSGKILYTSKRENDSFEPNVQGYLTEFDLSTGEASILINDHLIYGFTTSPSGMKIAFHSNLGSFIYDVDEGLSAMDPTEFGFQLEIETLLSPSFSPDREKLAWRTLGHFTNREELQEGTLILHLRHMSSFLRGTYEVGPGTGYPLPARWSSSGAWLALETFLGSSNDIGIARTDVSKITWLEQARNPIWSPDNRWLAYQSMGEDEIRVVKIGDGELYSIGLPVGSQLIGWIDPAGLEHADGELEIAIDSEAVGIFIDESGTARDDMVAMQTFSEGTPSSYGDIASMNVDGTNFQILTEYGYNRDPVLSPDGTRIAYRSVPITITESDDPDALLIKGYYNIWVISVDGEQSWQLTASEEPRSIPDWSPDGSSVIFSQGEEGTLVEFEVDVNQSVLRTGTFDPQYSPDGSAIAYITQDGGLAWIDNEGHEYMVHSVDDLGAEQHVIDFDWLPDGRKLVYTIADESERVDQTTLGIEHAIWINSIDGSNPIQLTDYGRGVRVSPDGSNVAITTGNGYGDACIVSKGMVILVFSPDQTSVEILSMRDFEGFPEISTGDFYPVGEPNWINATILAGGFAETCSPDIEDDAGGYLLDIVGQTMLRFTEQILDSPSW
jgi:Tol biopolymer transport system component